MAHACLEVPVPVRIVVPWWPLLPAVDMLKLVAEVLMVAAVVGLCVTGAAPASLTAVAVVKISNAVLEILVGLVVV